MATAITRQLNYALKPTAPRGIRTKRVIPSVGSNPSAGIAMGETVIFYLPAGLANTVMDGQTAYLKFNLQTTSVATAAANHTVSTDFTASSIIRRLDVYGPGGSLLESVDRYGTLANVLYDLSCSASEMYGQSPLIGSSDGMANTDNRTGYSIAQTHAAAGTVTNNTIFCIPLISGLFQLQESYFPLYACSDDFRLEIVLDTQVNAFVIPGTAGITSTTCTIINPEVHVDFIQIEPSVIEQMQSVYAGRDLVLHGSSYHTYETTIPDATSGTYNSVLPCKAMSAKALLSTFRTLGTTAVPQGFTQSARTNPFIGALSTWNLNVGGIRCPQRPITASRAGDVSEFFAEAQKSYHALNDLQMTGSINRTGYTSATTVAVGDAPRNRAFFLGLNLNQLRGQNDSILSGMDLSKATSMHEANFVTAIAGMQTLDTFVFHDVLFVVDSNGMVTSKW